MQPQVGTTTLCSADALTANYALMDDDLQTVDGTNKWLQLYGETQTTLEITYTTGAAETNNTVEFYIEFGSGSVAQNGSSTMTWTRETIEYLDDSADQIVLEEWTYTITGAAAATAYTKRIQLPVCTKGIRIYAKENGVAANYGNLTIKANTVAAGAAFYNRSLQTVTLEVGALTLDTNLTQIGGVSVLVDDAAFTEGTTPVVPAGFIYDDAAALNSGDVGAARLTSAREQIIAGYDSVTGSVKTSEVAPLNDQIVEDDLLDTTNLAAATHYYPAATGQSMDGYGDLSLSGKFIDADGTFTMTVEAMNDEDTSSGDWIQVYGYDDKNNITTNSWTVTNGTLTFALSFNNMNYSYYRVKIVNDGATNTAIIKGRRKAL